MYLRGAAPATGRIGRSPVPRVEHRDLPPGAVGGKALSGIDSSLKERQGDPVQAELDQAMRRIGELTMENELLWQRVRNPGPLAKRRSSK